VFSFSPGTRHFIKSRGAPQSSTGEAIPTKRETAKIEAPDGTYDNFRGQKATSMG
jgi:hypothetical protein